jgi:hypothetical protein
MRAERSAPPTREHATRRHRWPGALPTVATTVATAVAAVVAAVLAAVALAVLAAPAALAHDEVVEVLPASGETVPAAPDRVELVLSAPAQELGTQVLVTGADGALVSEGPVELRGTTVVQPLRADLPAGTYGVQWRVTSSDGHPVTGGSTFTVAAPPVSAPAPAADAGSPAGTPAVTPPATPAGPAAEPAAEPADASADGASADGASPSPALLAGGAGLLLAAAGLGARQLRRRP